MTKNIEVVQTELLPRGARVQVDGIVYEGIGNITKSAQSNT